MTTPKTLLDEPTDCHEYTSVNNTNVCVDPADSTKLLGPIRWFEVVDGAGNVVFVNAAGRQVTFTNVTAGKAYGIRVRMFISAPGRIRVGW